MKMNLKIANLLGLDTSNCTYGFATQMTPLLHSKGVRFLHTATAPVNDYMLWAEKNKVNRIQVQGYGTLYCHPIFWKSAKGINGTQLYTGECKVDIENWDIPTSDAHNCGIIITSKSYCIIDEDVLILRRFDELIGFSTKFSA